MSSWVWDSSSEDFLHRATSLLLQLVRSVHMLDCTQVESLIEVILAKRVFNHFDRFHLRLLRWKLVNQWNQWSVLPDDWFCASESGAPLLQGI